MSSEGSFGTWQGTRYCPTGQAIIGFALRSESAIGDEVAADNFAAYCGDPFGPRTPFTQLAGKTIYETIASIHYRLYCRLGRVDKGSILP